jgi:hypothetical protein
MTVSRLIIAKALSTSGAKPYSPTNTNRSMLPRIGRFGDLRRWILSWWRSARISISSEARDRNNPISPHQISLQSSIIEVKLHPIRGCSPVVLGLRQGQICAAETASKMGIRACPCLSVDASWESITPYEYRSTKSRSPCTAAAHLMLLPAHRRSNRHSSVPRYARRKHNHRPSPESKGYLGLINPVMGLKGSPCDFAVAIGGTVDEPFAP